MMKTKILVIEDNEDNRRIVRDLLTSAGYEVIEAVTSYALSGDDVKAFEAGCDAYVTKPFSPRELLAKIREYLQ